MKIKVVHNTIIVLIYVFLSNQLLGLTQDVNVILENQINPYDILAKAENFSEKNQLDSAFKYVNMIIGEVDSEIIKVDYKLKNLRNSEMWFSIEQKLDSIYLSDYRGISHPELSVELWNIYLADQLYRKFSQYAEPIPPTGTKAYWAFQKAESKKAHKRRKRVSKIIKKMGWPTYSQVGVKAGDGIFYVLQHNRTKYMVKYIDQFKEKAFENEASKAMYAMMYDRILVNQGKKQFYGTQLTFLDNRKVFFPIDDPENLNERRAKMDLGSIESYAQMVGAEYNPNEDIPLVPTKF